MTTVGVLPKEQEDHHLPSPASAVSHVRGGVYRSVLVDAGQLLFDEQPLLSNPPMHRLFHRFVHSPRRSATREGTLVLVSPEASGRWTAAAMGFEAVAARAWSRGPVPGTGSVHSAN